MLSTMDTNRLLKLWDTTSWREKSSCRIPTLWTAAEFTPDGRAFVTGTYDGRLIFWNVSSGRAEVSMKAHGNRVSGVAFTPNGQAFASGGEDGSVELAARFPMAASDPSAG